MNRIIQKEQHFGDLQKFWGYPHASANTHMLSPQQELDQYPYHTGSKTHVSFDGYPNGSDGKIPFGYPNGEQMPPYTPGHDSLKILTKKRF